MPTYAQVQHLQQVAVMYMGKTLHVLAIFFGLWLASHIFSVLVIRGVSWAFARLMAICPSSWRSSASASWRSASAYWRRTVAFFTLE